MITDLKNTRVLVTGISGFIGSHLARRLEAGGAEVHGIVRENTDLWRLTDVKDRIQRHHADLREFEAVKKVVNSVKPQKVFHLAACVDTSRALAIVDEMIAVNVTGTMNLLHALDESNYDCFINTGTCEEYGDNPAPFKEDQVPNPVSPYSASKAAATMFCRMLHKTMGLPIVTLRPFLTYGPGQSNDMLIPLLIKNLLSGQTFDMTPGEQTREFNYVDDIVDGYIKASVSPAAIGEIINIGNGVEYRVRDVAELVVNLLNSLVKPGIGALSYRPGETLHFYCDNTKARTILGWKPRVDLEDGLRITIDWFKKRVSSKAIS